jgi:hypothetical protein
VHWFLGLTLYERVPDQRTLHALKARIATQRRAARLEALLREIIHQARARGCTLAVPQPSMQSPYLQICTQVEIQPVCFDTLHLLRYDRKVMSR